MELLELKEEIEEMMNALKRLAMRFFFEIFNFQFNSVWYIFSNSFFVTVEFYLILSSMSANICASREGVSKSIEHISKNCTCSG